jgi:hypothetical protein
LHFAAERQAGVNGDKAWICLFTGYVHLGIGVGLVSILDANIAHTFMHHLNLMLDINMNKLIALPNASNHHRRHLKQVMRSRINIHTKLKLLIQRTMRNLHINYFLAQFVWNFTTFLSYGQAKGVLDAGGGWREDYCVGNAVGGVGKEDGRGAGGQAEG